jgi:hypothetical protein
MQANRFTQRDQRLQRPVGLRVSLRQRVVKRVAVRLDLERLFHDTDRVIEFPGFRELG